MIKYYLYKIYFLIKHFIKKHEEKISEILFIIFIFGIPILIIGFFSFLYGIRNDNTEDKEYKIEQACYSEGGLMWLGDCYKRGPKIKILLKNYEVIVEK